MSAEQEYMPFDEKLLLSLIVEKLPVNEHHYIYKIVLEGDPSALEDCEDDPAWTYVEFNQLKPATLKALEGYIASRVYTQNGIQENNPVPQSEKSSAESTAKTVESSNNKGKKGSSEKAEKRSIKTRIRTSKSSGTSSKKQD